MTTMKTLILHASSLGFRVHGAYLPDGLMGLYSPEEQRLYFDLRLTPNERCSVLAHELGHAHYGHDGKSSMNERQADAFAARLLIDPEMYAELEMQEYPIADIADALGVTEEVVVAFQDHCLERIGAVTYARPRMGSGQWQHRVASI